MDLDTDLWLASPRSALRSLEHALDVDGAAFGDYRCVNAPGVTVSVEEMLAALARHGGDRGLVDFVPDPAVAAIVGTWPARFDTSKAAAMGFPDACSIDAMVRSHIEDELN
jgi:nucleoside-diphosphate-sugar epimerase|tara:strand:- start:1611 stop:1943 length:333 start_codon:yes stop_codon:yes gene_type:complete